MQLIWPGPISSITLKSSTTGPGATVTLAASARRPSNRPRREDRNCLPGWGQSNLWLSMPLSENYPTKKMVSLVCIARCVLRIILLTENITSKFLTSYLLWTHNMLRIRLGQLGAGPC